MTQGADRIVQLAPRVHAVQVSHVEGWCGILDGPRRTVAIDAGKDLPDGEAVNAAAVQLGRIPDTLVYTHGHWDHVRGGLAFGAAEVVAHADAAPMAVAQLQLTTGELDSPGRPSILTRGEVGLELGGLEATLVEVPGHAPGGYGVLVPEHGILFAGDTVVTAIPPAFSDGNTAILEQTLRDLARRDLRIIVPGHGPLLRGRRAIEDWLTWLADYLARMREAVAALLPDLAPDEIVQRVDFASYVGSRLPADRYQMVERHERNVRQVMVELAGSPP